MKCVIRLDAPRASSLLYLLEQMVDDPYVGMLPHQERQKWLDSYRQYVEQRYKNDELSTVAYVGSGIVGIAFSRPLSRSLGNLSYYANMKDDNDYWKLGNFFVLKEYRGQGIGKQALNKFMEIKDGKVCYFANRENGASNRVAQACGLINTHDFCLIEASKKYELGKKDFAIRKPATYYHSYTGRIPEKEFILKPNLILT